MTATSGYVLGVCTSGVAACVWWFAWHKVFRYEPPRRKQLEAAYNNGWQDGYATCQRAMRKGRA